MLFRICSAVVAAIIALWIVFTIFSSNVDGSTAADNLISDIVIASIVVLMIALSFWFFLLSRFRLDRRIRHTIPADMVYSGYLSDQSKWDMEHRNHEHLKTGVWGTPAALSIEQNALQVWSRGRQDPIYAIPLTNPRSELRFSAGHGTFSGEQKRYLRSYLTPEEWQASTLNVTMPDGVTIATVMDGGRFELRRTLAHLRDRGYWVEEMPLAPQQ